MYKNPKSLEIRLGKRGARHVLKGREAWAAARLIEAGRRGCTPITVISEVAA